MDWLFERTIELAAWVAFVLCMIFFCDSLYNLYLWVTYLPEGDQVNPIDSGLILLKSCEAAAKFVGAAIAMGILACIDHYVFDLPEEV